MAVLCLLGLILASCGIFANIFVSNGKANDAVFVLDALALFLNLDCMTNHRTVGIYVERIRGGDNKEG